MTAQTKDDLRSHQIAQVGREIAEACLEQGGWLEASQERCWCPGDWEWTSGDYDYAQEVLGDMPLEEVQAVRAAVVARLQEAVDAAQGVATSNPDKMRTYRTDVCTVWSGNDSAHVTVEAWGDFGGVYVKVCEGKQVQFVSLSLDQLGFLKVALASLDLPPTYLAENDSNHD